MRVVIDRYVSHEPTLGTRQSAGQSPAGLRLDRVRSVLACPNAGDAFDRGHPNLAVTDLVGSSTTNHRIDSCLDLRVIDEDLDAGLGRKEHSVLGSAVGLRVAALSTKALHL